MVQLPPSVLRHKKEVAVFSKAKNNTNQYLSKLVLHDSVNMKEYESVLLFVIFKSLPCFRND
jgi:hypothetical protein